MTRFIIGRAGLLALAWLVASVLIFATLRILPGDVAQVIGGTQASPAQVEALREQLGLNRPLFAQYVDWIGGVLRFDLGHSVVTGTEISSELAEKAEVTIPLTIMSLAVVLLVALPLGVFAAYRNSTTLGQLVSASSVLASAIPVVWAGLLGTLVLSSWLGWLPSQGFPQDGWERPFQAFRSLVLPALTIGLIEGAILFRLVRSATLRALDADHVRTAMSQGNSRLRALLTQGLPGVGLSIISMLGLQAAALLVGAVVVEQLFSLPGLGTMLVSDVGERDLPKVQSTLLVLTSVILVMGALVDVVHRIIDPRLRAEGEE
ncbi:peptide/nickel transport system permease protein [Leucobacter komagatae]|uniref:Peptide/nickel transport system permease protein n=1 Tax=Leucobacter komagatae TaxID=55969 RepID=A0A542Y1U1_9MICO|nr:ABC transporter permease [Leucobacter komagatae]TQL42040.1 peptide/nickel transport system permease protein [Leucobacter komagatae]